MKKYALISVSNKKGLIKLAAALMDLGYTIISTSGTSRYLKDNDIENIEVSDITHFPEILSGRVKSLHPSIFGGILARNDVPSDMDDVKTFGIPKISVVCVNFYPFENMQQNTKEISAMLEYIDIGGPSLVRAAAKNYKDVIVLTDPDDYVLVMRELIRSGDINIERRKKLAIKAFTKTSYYDSVIANALSEEGAKDTLPYSIVLGLQKEANLRYGENPHQPASVYRIAGTSQKPMYDLLWGKTLSFNNIVDMAAAYSIVREFKEPTVSIVKHTNPTGVASDFDFFSAYQSALECDQESAFGGIVAFNGDVDEEMALHLNERFFEVIIAKGYTNEALEIMKKKKKRRIVVVKQDDELEWDIKVAFNRILLQNKDDIVLNEDQLRVVPEGKLDKITMEDIIFGYKIVKHIRSNAIVVVKEKRTVGIGAGQMSRVKSVTNALHQAGEEANGAVLASDGFFPFSDSIELAARYGIRTIVQPGGSIRDNEVLEASERAGITMVLTGIRHFRH